MKLSPLVPALFALTAITAAAQNSATETGKPPAAAEASPATKEHAWTVTQINGQDYVSLDEVASYYKFEKPAVEGDSVTLRSPRLVAVFKKDGDEVRFNNVLLKLLRPLTSKDGTVMVSRRDLSSLLDPVIRPRSLQDTTPFDTVLLDVRGPADTGDRAELITSLKSVLEPGGCKTLVVDRDSEGKAIEPVSAVTANALLLSVNLERDISAGKEDLFTFVPDIDVEAPETSVLNRVNQALGVAVHAQLLYRTMLPDNALRRKVDPLVAALKIPAVSVSLKYPAAPSSEFAGALARGILNCRQGLWPVAGKSAPVPALPRRNRDIPKVDLKPAPAKQQQ